MANPIQIYGLIELQEKEKLASDAMVSHLVSSMRGKD